ncbi:MAG: peptidoglycan DD-metalloendopeptidase family protein [Bacteroidales bacterium]|nr:peptidoglycan DD-metalloendopeptidase family protein [Bacteroidales bacterium]
MRRILLITLCLLAFSFESFSQDVSAQTQQKRKLEEEIEYIDNQLKSIVSQQKASMQQMTLLQKKITNRKSLVSQADKEIRQINDQITQKNREIREIQKELDTLQTYYSNLVYNTYKNRDNRVWFMYLLASQDIGQGYRRYSYIKNLSESVSRQADVIRETRAQLEQEKEKLSEMSKELQAVKKEREKEYNSLLSEEKSSQSVLNTLNRNKTKYTNELNQKKKEVERLNKEIERILSQTVKAQKEEEIDYNLAGQFEENRGKLPWPVQGVITEQFGDHYHPVYKNIKLPTNNGISITTTKNAEVRCVFDGIVKQVLLMPGYNQCILVQHGTYFTFYCKLKQVSVKAGQNIKAGDKLGVLDVVENASVLHFQIWKGTEKQNPEKWLR